MNKIPSNVKCHAGKNVFFHYKLHDDGEFFHTKLYMYQYFTVSKVVTAVWSHIWTMISYLLPGWDPVILENIWSDKYCSGWAARKISNLKNRWKNIELTKNNKTYFDLMGSRQSIEKWIDSTTTKHFRSFTQVK